MAVLAACLVGLVAAWLLLATFDEAPLPNGCPSDEYNAPNGKSYGRSVQEYCCFVDDAGGVVFVDDICRRLRAR
jgi:hypothetical protein